MSEPLIARVPEDQLSPKFREEWRESHRVAGEATYVEVFANHPALLNWYYESFYAKLFNNGDGTMLNDAKTNELLRLRISRGTGCHVCNSFNAPSAIAAGYTQAQVDTVSTPTAKLFSERELAVLDLVGEIEFRNPEGKLSPELYARLRRHFSDAQILELGVVAAYLAAMGKVFSTFDLVTRDEVCPLDKAA